MSRWYTLSVVVGIGVVGAGLWYWVFDRRPQTLYRTAPVKRGDLVVNVSATGTIEPEALVDIGAQVQGKVVSFGKDDKSPTKMIDWNSEVQAGTVLAKIDDSLYVATAEKAAALLKKAKADLPGLRALMVDAQEEWQRAQVLVTSDSESVERYQRARADYDAAVANLAVGVATVSEAAAALQRAEDNVGYCTITSPTRGVVVDRRVNIGQTVVSSLNAPSLFLIAKDLSDMQVWASVNEADVGRIRPGQKVTFTVAAYPGVNFTGDVAKRGIRRNASLTQNVVTYTVLVDYKQGKEWMSKHPEVKLQPYMTANMLFEVARKDNVLKVPNAALRWRPDVDQVAPAERKAFQNTPATSDDDEDEFTSGAKGTLWVEDGRYVRPVQVTLGLTNGTSTEIIDGIKDGTAVVVGVIQRHKVRGGNPFLPKRN
jgi:HlyD family secretion protein